MFFVYIASMLSRYTLQVNKSLLLSNQPTKNTEVVNLNTHKKISNKKNISNYKNKEENLWSKETKNYDNNQEEILQEKDNQENILNEELYEEINLHDDFDEDYRNDVDSNYVD